MKRTLAVLFLALAAIGCSEKEGNLKLSGNIHGLKKGTIFIQKLGDSGLVVLDSIPVSGDSKFETTLQIDSPEMLYMYLDRGASNTIDNNLPFFAEPGDVKIETDLETFFAKAKITGSKNHDLYEEFKKVKSRYTNQELTMTEQELNAFKDNTALPADHKAKYDALVRKRYLYAINFAINNKDYEVAPYIALSETADASTKYLDMIQKAMTPEVAKSKYGIMLNEYLAERKKEEEQVPQPAQ